MKKILKYITLFILLIAILHVVIWYVISSKIADAINVYAEKEIPIKRLNYNAKFHKAYPYGYPWSIGIKIVKLTEELKGSILAHDNPLYFGYNFITQDFFMQYSGQSRASYKPVSSGFGSLIKGNIDYRIHLPLSMKLIQRFFNEKFSSHEFVNFIQSVNLKQKDIKIYDNVDYALIFNHDKTNIIFSYEDIPVYYEKFEDIINNIPKKYNLYYYQKILNAASYRSVAPFGLVYGLLLPQEVDFEGKIELETESKTLNLLSILSKSKVKIPFIRSYTKGDRLDVELECVSYLPSKFDCNNKIELSTSKENLQNGIDAYKQVLDMPFHRYKKELEAARNAVENLFPLILNLVQDKISLSLDIGINKQNENYNIDLRDFSIFFREKTGISMKNKTLISDSNQSNTDGMMLMHNYNSFLDLIVYLIYKNTLNDEQKLIAHNTLNVILKKISNHPDSTSSDLDFDYKFDFSDFSESKINNFLLQDIILEYKQLLIQNNFNPKLEEQTNKK